MNERFGILHLSDIHASTKTKTTIQRLVEQLITDLQNIQKNHSVQIRMICISGDLIHSGDTDMCSGDKATGHAFWHAIHDVQFSFSH